MNKNKLFTICDFYILSRLIYELQAFLFGGSGSFIAQLFFLFFFGTSVYYTYYAIKRYRLPAFMKALSVLLAMFTIYGIIPILMGEKYQIGPFFVPGYAYLQQIYLSLLPIFAFFVFFKKGLLGPERIQRWIIIFFIALIIQFIQEKNKALQLLMDTGSRSEEVTNNVGYYFLGLIPLLAFLSKKRVLQYIGLSLIMLFIILSVKRGAIVIGAVCIFWFLYNTLKNTRRSQRAILILLSVVVVIVGVYLVHNMLENNEYFYTRLEKTIDGDTSGRDYYYTKYWNHFTKESNLLEFLFGNGANATIKIGGNYAHNDWLEIAINQGFMGLIIYLIYFVRFFKSSRVARFDNATHLALSLLFIIEISKTMISMSYSDLSIQSTFCLGLCMGIISDYESSKNFQVANC